MLVRALERADWPAVIALNQDSVSELSELDAPRLEFLLECAHRALVVEDAGAVVAFALAMAPGSDYDSPNYRWFGERYERFLYLDRIAVDRDLRRRGIGAHLYDEMEDAARAFERMVCEVNLEPANNASLEFHAARGYRELELLRHPGKLVVLMSKELGAGG
jgi:predicted GNAT superfamily acetyltransferase